MIRKASDTPSEDGAAATLPSEERAALALREVAVVMAPLARWLMRHGVSYSAFASMLKAVFVDAARAELERTGAHPTQSSLSVLSGVHRKDVRALESREHAPGTALQPVRSVPLASQVFTRWLSEPRFCSRDGRPKKLARTGGRNSFEALARALSQDVHPRTVLDELLRLGLVRLEGDDVVPIGTAFVPNRRHDEMTALFAANAADHIAAAVHNLTADAPRFLEQSVFADGLGAHSVAHLHECARAAWQAAFSSMVAEANCRLDADAQIADGEAHRMRFGVYYYSEPVGAEPAAPKRARPASAAAPPRKRKPPARRSP
jgi:hypothetical protein